MVQDHGYWEDGRKHIIPPIGKVLQAVGESIGVELYANAHSRDHEFVGRVDMSEEELEGYLHEWGFHQEPLASLKSRLQHSEIEEGSWRKVGFDGEDDEYQLHLILYDGSQINNANTGETFIYAHWEYRWDVHPIKNFRGVGKDDKKGVTMIRDLLDENFINYEYVQP